MPYLGLNSQGLTTACESSRYHVVSSVRVTVNRFPINFFTRLYQFVLFIHCISLCLMNLVHTHANARSLHSILVQSRYRECGSLSYHPVILNCSEHFKSFDPFANQKKRSLTESVSCVTSLALHLESSMRRIANSGNSEGLEKLCLQLLQVSMHFFRQTLILFSCVTFY